MAKFRMEQDVERYMRGLAALGEMKGPAGYYIWYGYSLLFPSYRYLTGRIRELSGTDNQDALRRKLEWMVEKGHRQSFNRIRHILSPLPSAQRQEYIATKEPETEKAQSMAVIHTMDGLPAAGIAAYDLGTAIYLCRAAMRLRWIGPAYGRDLQINCSNALQEWYSGWDEYAAAYIAGAAYAAGADGPARIGALQRQAISLMGLASGFADNRIPWRTALPAPKYKEAGF
ncbi:MAG: hypothetical protein K0Q90_1620 [Paenibacillaceae bacterium]|jgi:hypothetical protein|nr:hypothetical protein [Paenibacillaceae bacterium]